MFLDERRATKESHKYEETWRTENHKYRNKCGSWSISSGNFVDFRRAMPIEDMLESL